MFPADLPPPPQPTPIVETAEDHVLERIAKPIVRQAAQPWVSLFEQAWETARGKIDAIREQVNPPLTAEERKAMELVRSMLAPNKLGGQDRTFNHSDIDAITKGIKDRGVRGVVARSLIRRQMPAGLDEAGVVADPRAQPDTTPRSISSSELQRFSAASEIMKRRGERLEQFGLRVVFKNGLSEAALDHMLAEKAGLPPGATLEVLAPER